MFCRNCGNEMTENAAVCVKCGVPAGKGNLHCPNCGADTHPEAVFCVHCGVSLAQKKVAATDARSKLVAGLLGIFLGYLGIHNFYLGYTQKAIAQLLITCLTCGAGSFVSGVWGLVEGVMLLCGKIDVDGEGKPLAD